MGYIEIKRTDEGFEFARITEDGERRELGSATERMQFEGTEDEERWYEGTFDTQDISFEDEAECGRIVRKRKPNDEVVFS